MPMASNSTRDLAAFLIVTALLIPALVLGREVLTPLALATILAFILAPVVRFLIDHQRPRPGSRLRDDRLCREHHRLADFFRRPAPCSHGESREL